MKPASAKAKGRKLQQQVCADIRGAFPMYLQPGDVESRSMGASGVDVMLSPAARALFPYAVECKAVERLNVYEAFVQAASDARKDTGTPLVVHRRNHGEALATLRWKDFLALAAFASRHANP